MEDIENNKEVIRLIVKKIEYLQTNDMSSEIERQIDWRALQVVCRNLQDTLEILSLQS